ncbi:EndoU domain-containing protein [Thermomonospora catenispora]|uniref:EndoU domain-containing protein n=1 Tax=Thermomonospora catenispora TaxID=2493090 RepID=UPI001120F659|nr:EndoU domain-containing protein [Thermomonospora catenispora]TNY38214.1 hypothetical protein EIO00_04175 [Thermomonospora catenispora]
MGLLKPIEKWLLRRVEKYKYQHIFLGNVNPKKKKGTGFHHRYQGKNPPTARVARDSNGNEEIKKINSNGVYKAKVEVRGEDGKWYPKAGLSSFFPDHWTPKEVNDAIRHAFKNSRPDPTHPNKWIGQYNGVDIVGFYTQNRKDWVSAWPLL